MRGAKLCNMPAISLKTFDVYCQDKEYYQRNFKGYGIAYVLALSAEIFLLASNSLFIFDNFF